MAERKQISDCFDMPLHMTNDEAVAALVDEDAAKLAEIRTKRATIRATRDSYLTAYDAAKDDQKRYAVLCCVRQDQVCDPMEVAAKTADIKAGIIKMGA